MKKTESNAIISSSLSLSLSSSESLNLFLPSPSVCLNQQTTCDLVFNTVLSSLTVSSSSLNESFETKLC